MMLQINLLPGGRKSASAAGGFPFADIPFAGVSTVVVTDNDPALARKLADELATICWERRSDFTIRPVPNTLSILFFFSR